MLQWEQGRQGTGYYKMRLFLSQKLKTDCYLIRYPAGSSIPTHTDPVEGRKHYRLNILLLGEDNFQGETIFSTKRIKFFRPDIMPHSVGVVKSPRLIFSLGWATNK